jgi:hypothetical protein
MREEEQERCKLLQLQPKPKLQLKLRPNPHPAPKPKSAPKLARRWESVPSRAKSQWAPVSPGPALKAGLSMAERCLIIRRDKSVPLSNKMDQEIASAINSALFHQKALAHMRIMNTKRNAKGAITVITHLNATAEMALQYRDIIITVARTVDKGVVDIQENKSWEWPKIHQVPLVRYMGRGTEGRQKLQEVFEAENEGIVIPTQIWWLANPLTVREMRQNGEISMSSVVFVVKGSRVAQSAVKTEIKVVGV